MEGWGRGALPPQAHSVLSLRHSGIPQVTSQEVAWRAAPSLGDQQLKLCRGSEGPSFCFPLRLRALHPGSFQGPRDHRNEDPAVFR